MEAAAVVAVEDPHVQAALEAAAAELGDIMEEHDPTCVLAALVQFMRGHKWDIPTQSVRFMSLLFAMHPEAGPTLDARIRVAFPKYYRKLFASDKAADDERIAYILKWVRDFCANEHEDEVTEEMLDALKDATRYVFAIKKDSNVEGLLQQLDW